MEGANYQLVRAGSYIWKAWITPTVLCVDCLSVCVHFPAASGCCGKTQHSRNSGEARGVSSWHHVIKTSAAWCLPRVSSANGTLRMTLKPFFFFFQLKQLIVQRGAIRAAQWSLGLKRLKPSSVNLCLIHTKLVAWESDSCEAFWVRSSVSVHVVTIATASRSLTMRVPDILQEEKGIGGTMSFFYFIFFLVHKVNHVVSQRAVTPHQLAAVRHVKQRRCTKAASSMSSNMMTVFFSTTFILKKRL